MIGVARGPCREITDRDHAPKGAAVGLREKGPGLVVDIELLSRRALQDVLEDLIYDGDESPKPSCCERQELLA